MATLFIQPPKYGRQTPHKLDPTRLLLDQAEIQGNGKVKKSFPLHYFPIFFRTGIHIGYHP
jgi:hypothetical protein